MMKKFYKKLISTGFIHVIFSSLFSNFCLFLGSVIYARLLGVEEYGTYSYAFNLVSIFLLINGLGVASGVLQFVSQNHDDAEKYLLLAFKVGFKFNTLLAIIINIYIYLFYPKELGYIGVAFCLSFLPFIRLYFDVICSYLRALRRNKELAIFNISNSILVVVLSIVGVYFYGIWGIVLGLYIGNILSLFVSYQIIGINIFVNKNIDIVDLKSFKHYSIHSTISNAFSQILYLLDIFILGYVINDAVQVGLYKVASSIPFALNFFPIIIISFFYPYIVQNRSNRSQLISYYFKLFTPILIFSTIISTVLIIYAGDIIQKLYGIQYLASIKPFKILLLGFIIASSFRIINGNFLAALGDSRMVMSITLITFIFNIITTPFLIFQFGINGAAYSIVSVFIFSSILTSIRLYKKMQIVL